MLSTGKVSVTFQLFLHDSTGYLYYYHAMNRIFYIHIKSYVDQAFFSFSVLNIVAIAGTTNLQTVRSSSFLCLPFPHIEGSKQVAALHEPSYVGGFTAFSLLA